MQITILKIGPLKEKYFQTAEQDFLKRLKPFAQLKVVTLPSVPLKKTNTVEQVMQQEGQAISGFLAKNPTHFIVALELTGKTLSSEELAAQIKTLRDQGRKVIFLIGGPYGLSSAVLQKTHLKLSFSRLTCTHSLIYLFLLEQIYRSFTIITGKKYHY